MREILFKAKRIDNGEWVEGSLIVLDADSGYYFIAKEYLSASTLPVRSLIYDNTHLVDENTICQYTGLTDKNGNKIWENDVIFAGDNTVVTWNEYYASWSLTKKGWMYSHFFGESVDAKEDCVVIGNIFDNPELLGGADNV